MKYITVLLAIVMVLLVISTNSSEPSFNGTNPGCDGSGCHALEDGLVTASVTGLDVAITVNGTTSSVAGELVDGSGTVVAVNNSTGNNPFTLTSPGPGIYTVNAGFKNPNPRRWDSVVVNISITDIGGHSSNPTSFRLFDNYPNPFNPSTVISYQLPVSGYVSLKVYDILGNEIATLVDEYKSAGKYTIEFNSHSGNSVTGELSSGIYLYKLQSGNPSTGSGQVFTETKKMMLVR